MKYSPLEAAESGAAKVEASGDELHVSLLQNVIDHLRIPGRREKTIVGGAQVSHFLGYRMRGFTFASAEHASAQLKTGETPTCQKGLSTQKRYRRAPSLVSAYSRQQP